MKKRGGIIRTRDDDDNIVTKDGRKWDDYDHKEIKSHGIFRLAQNDAYERMYNPNKQ